MLRRHVSRSRSAGRQGRAVLGRFGVPCGARVGLRDDTHLLNALPARRVTKARPVLSNKACELLLRNDIATAASPFAPTGSRSIARTRARALLCRSGAGRDAGAPRTRTRTRTHREAHARTQSSPTLTRSTDRPEHGLRLKLFLFSVRRFSVSVSPKQIHTVT